MATEIFEELSTTAEARLLEIVDQEFNSDTDGQSGLYLALCENIMETRNMRIKYNNLVTNFSKLHHNFNHLVEAYKTCLRDNMTLRRKNSLLVRRSSAVRQLVQATTIHKGDGRRGMQLRSRYVRMSG